MSVFPTVLRHIAPMPSSTQATVAVPRLEAVPSRNMLELATRNPTIATGL